MLPLSHDEVVYGKRSLIGKMPGDNWQRFANLRAYFGFMWGHPGKKLLFMGGEIAQEHEWSHDGELDWACARRSAAPRRAAAGARPQPHLCAASRRCISATPSPPASAGWSATTGRTRCLPSCASATKPRPRAGRLQHDAGAALGLSASACRALAAGASCSTPTPRSMAAPTWAMAAASRPCRCSAMARRSRSN